MDIEEVYHQVANFSSEQRRRFVAKMIPYIAEYVNRDDADPEIRQLALDLYRKTGGRKSKWTIGIITTLAVICLLIYFWRKTRSKEIKTNLEHVCVKVSLTEKFNKWKNNMALGIKDIDKKLYFLRNTISVDNEDMNLIRIIGRQKPVDVSGPRDALTSIKDVLNDKFTEIAELNEDTQFSTFLNKIGLVEKNHKYFWIVCPFVADANDEKKAVYEFLDRNGKTASKVCVSGSDIKFCDDRDPGSQILNVHWQVLSLLIKEYPSKLKMYFAHQMYQGSDQNDQQRRLYFVKNATVKENGSVVGIDSYTSAPDKRLVNNIDKKIKNCVAEFEKAFASVHNDLKSLATDFAILQENSEDKNGNITEYYFTIDGKYLFSYFDDDPMTSRCMIDIVERAVDRYKAKYLDESWRKDRALKLFTGDITHGDYKISKQDQQIYFISHSQKDIEDNEIYIDNELYDKKTEPPNIPAKVWECVNKFIGHLPGLLEKIGLSEGNARRNIFCILVDLVENENGILEFYIDDEFMFKYDTETDNIYDSEDTQYLDMSQIINKVERAVDRYVVEHLDESWNPDIDP